jgi:hypothetical protein
MKLFGAELKKKLHQMSHPKSPADQELLKEEY